MCKLRFGRSCLQPAPSFEESVSLWCTDFLWGLSFLETALLLPPGSLQLCPERDKHQTSFCSSHRRQSLQSVPASGEKGRGQQWSFLFCYSLSTETETVGWVSLSPGWNMLPWGLGVWAVLQDISILTRDLKPVSDTAAEGKFCTRWSDVFDEEIISLEKVVVWSLHCLEYLIGSWIYFS